MLAPNEGEEPFSTSLLAFNMERNCPPETRTTVDDVALSSAFAHDVREPPDAEAPRSPADAVATGSPVEGATARVGRDVRAPWLGRDSEVVIAAFGSFSPTRPRDEGGTPLLVIAADTDCDSGMWPAARSKNCESCESCLKCSSVLVPPCLQ